MKRHALFLTGMLLPMLAVADPVIKVGPELPIEHPVQGSLVGEPGISPAVLTEGFLSAHPDLRWRREGLHAYANKRHGEAMEYFLRAARYADKPAQAMIAEMYWNGVGVAQDRALGYAWMDLAAERFYPNLLIVREAYWAGISESEQRDAIERGQALLAEYGDDVAKPRMAKALRKGRSVTGSRVGFVGNLEIIPFTGPNAGNGMSIRGDEYYAPKYWQPDKYFEMQDRAWNAPVRKGRVEVGEVEQANRKPATEEPAPP